MPSIDMRFMRSDSKKRLQDAGIDIFHQNSGEAANFDGAQIDLKEMGKYVKIVLDTEFTENNVPTYYSTKFRMCTKEDFEKRGITLDKYKT